MSATVQGELWSSDPRGWAETAEGRIRPLYERVLEGLHPLPGTRLLDAGCGSGLFAELAAQGGADVIGLDAAPGLVEYARRRRPAAGYVVGDLERMPFGDGDGDIAVLALAEQLDRDTGAHRLAGHQISERLIRRDRKSVV